MLLIACPLCGPRAGAEFTFERPVESILPLTACTEEATERLFTRDNPRGPSAELWRHAYGCRAWIVLTRNTSTHDITDIRLFEPPPAGEGP
jgi:sarcosine oxidase subunit delta